MIWNEGYLSTGALNDPDAVAALSAAQYLLTYNEPQLTGQANIAASRAAELWPQVEQVARAYGLQIVAPCLKDGNEAPWYDDWLAACVTLRGKPCDFNYTCTHQYMYPEPCSLAWGCARALEPVLDRWLAKYNRPMWITEFACSPWAAATAGLSCDASVHKQLMDQVRERAACSRVCMHACTCMHAQELTCLAAHLTTRSPTPRARSYQRSRPEPTSFGTHGTQCTRTATCPATISMKTSIAATLGKCARTCTTLVPVNGRMDRQRLHSAQH